MHKRIVRITFVLTLLLSSWVLTASTELEVAPRANPAGQITHYGSIYFYAITGEWPTSWAELRDFGIVKRSLTVEGNAVDPDNTDLDFYGDLYYKFESDDGHPWIVSLYYMNGNRIINRPIMTNFNYDNWFEEIPAEVAHLLPEPTLARKKQIAIAGIAQHCARYYAEKFGVAHNSWSEFVNSEYSPIDSTLVNPLTGLPFRGDGSPNDLLFTSEGQQVSILPVKPDGTIEWPINLP